MSVTVLEKLFPGVKLFCNFFNGFVNQHNKVQDKKNGPYCHFKKAFRPNAPKLIQKKRKLWLWRCLSLKFCVYFCNSILHFHNKIQNHCIHLYTVARSFMYLGLCISTRASMDTVKKPNLNSDLGNAWCRPQPAASGEIHHPPVMALRHALPRQEFDDFDHGPVSSVYCKY
jgi:hypothetical protein